MLRKFILPLFFLVFSALLAMLILTTPTINAVDSSPSPTPLIITACESRGGVNCSILNPDGFTTCNDDTIDPTLIYAITECRETIKKIVQEQSDFMAKSGCLPPSELRCTDEPTYQKLLNKLTSSRLINSELAREEITSCYTEITEYQQDEYSYKQCLLKNGRPDFVPSGHIVTPILKALFCPMVYGQNSLYDEYTGLCSCDSGYFKYQGKCVEASLICQSKYGTDASARNGSCVIPPKTSTPPVKPVISSSARRPEDSHNPPETILTTPGPNVTYRPQISIRPEITNSPGPTETFQNPTKEPRLGFIQNIINSITSVIEKVLNLF